MNVEEFIQMLDSIDKKSISALEWLEGKLKGNLSKPIQGINVQEIYIGNRCIDSKLVLGYPSESSGLIDVGMLADWSVKARRDPTVAEVIKLMGNAKAFESFEKLNNTSE